MIETAAAPAVETIVAQGEMLAKTQAAQIKSTAIAEVQTEVDRVVQTAEADLSEFGDEFLSTGVPSTSTGGRETAGSGGTCSDLGAKPGNIFQQLVQLITGGEVQASSARSYLIVRTSPEPNTM